MSDNKGLFKSVLLSLFPKGAIWSIKQDSDFDKFIDGEAESLGYIKDYCDTLSDIRNPYKIPFEMLSDLEKEYGQVTDLRLTEEVRREQLGAIVYAGNRLGTDDELQTELDMAGFNLLVHKNDPPVDPAIFLDQAFQMTCGSDNAFCGFFPGIGLDSTAVCGQVGGDYIVNGEINKQLPAVAMECDGGFAFCGEPDAVAGQFDTLLQIPLVYPLPTDSDEYPFVFFVGGVATRDPITDELTDIQQGQVDSARKQELFRIILRFKPIDSACGLIVTYI